MYYSDYFWKNGLPIGMNRTEGPSPLCYKIISDPYKKHITIESYRDGDYHDIIYDSLLLDFRHLNVQGQTAWQKETVSEAEDKTIILLRDINERVIFLEHHYFKDDLCTTCEVYSPHGWLASVSRMHYGTLGDPFNGVILYDRNDHPVMKKIYEVNEMYEYTELVEETWDFSII